MSAEDPLHGTAACRDARLPPRTARSRQIRILRLERRSAIHARTKTVNQVHALVSTAPEPLRAKLRDMSLAALLTHCTKLRRVETIDAASATQRVLRGLARRWQQLDREVALLDAELETLVMQRAPELVALRGVGEFETNAAS
jgi:transposase